MKLISCNGRLLTIRDVGPVLVELSAAAVPLKDNGTKIVEDDLARRRLRELIDSGLYKRTV